MKPRRVACVFGPLNVGGAELCMYDLLTRLGPAGYTFDFISLSAEKGTLHDLIVNAGGRIHLCPLNWRFARDFRRILRETEVEVLDCSLHYSSGFLLMLGAWERVPMRIAHLHTMADGRAFTPRRRLQRRLMRSLIDRYATEIVGVSEGVLEAAWSADWRMDPRCKVLYNGVDTQRFARLPSRAEVRRQLGLSPGGPYLVHVGSMQPAKNQLMLLSVFKSYLALAPTAKLLIVGRGSGAYGTAVHQAVKRLGLSENVLLLGERRDVERWLRAADAMVFPSTREGLPTVVTEAVAAGTPVVASDLAGIVEMSRLIAGITPASVSDSPQTWAGTIDDVVRSGKDLLCGAVDGTPLDLSVSASGYANLLSGSGGDALAGH